MWPERPQRKNGETRPMFQIVLCSVETLVVEALATMCKCLLLHQFNERLKALLGLGDTIWIGPIFALHSFDAICNPRLQEQLTRGVNFQSANRISHRLPELLVQSCVHYTNPPFLSDHSAPTPDASARALRDKNTPSHLNRRIGFPGPKRFPVLQPEWKPAYFEWHRIV
jgi:hypothetical protein